MKFLRNIFLLFLIMVTQYSCRKCEGECDTIFRTNGAALNISDTIINMDKGERLTIISIDPIVVKTDGDRDCKYENEVSCSKDGLSVENLSIYCNKELVLNGNLYPMNTDLLEVPALIKSSTDPTKKIPFIVLEVNSDFPKGRYHFKLQGKTDDGKDVEDIGVVSWEN